MSRAELNLLYAPKNNDETPLDRVTYDSLNSTSCSHVGVIRVVERERAAGGGGCGVTSYSRFNAVKRRRRRLRRKWAVFFSYVRQAIPFRFVTCNILFRSVWIFESTFKQRQ